MLIMQTYELHALIQVMMNSKEKKTFISGRHTNKSIKRGLNNGSDMPFLIEFEITILFLPKSIPSKLTTVLHFIQPVPTVN